MFTEVVRAHEVAEEKRSCPIQRKEWYQRPSLAPELRIN